MVFICYAFPICKAKFGTKINLYVPSKGNKWNGGWIYCFKIKGSIFFIVLYIQFIRDYVVPTRK